MYLLDTPNVSLARPEKTEDGSYCFKVTIKSNPETFLVHWKIKKQNNDRFEILNPDAAEYKGTSNSPTNPMLVVKEKNQLDLNCFQIEVQNLIGCTIKDIPGRQTKKSRENTAYAFLPL